METEALLFHQSKPALKKQHITVLEITLLTVSLYLMQVQFVPNTVPCGVF